VVLLGFTALAIDGGMVLSDRRQAQNSADAAAMAAALQKVNGQSNSNVTQAARYSALANGYDPANINVTFDTVHDFSGNYDLITVDITETTETSFIQMFWGDAGMVSRVTATTRVRVSQPFLPGVAIIAMGNCVEDGGNLINGNGGGNSGGVRAFNGGIFLNTPETNGSRCALSPPNNGYGIMSETEIFSVGSANYGSVANISPRPIETGVNGGSPIDDPLADLPEPSCGTTAGSVVGGVYQPGNYGGANMALGSGTLAKGIYCITGSIHLSGHDAIIGDGVVLYFKNGGPIFSGNAYLQLKAPSPSDSSDANTRCSGTVGSPTATCTYVGISIFAARNNHSTIEVRGNGQSAIRGLVYALNGELMARGGGSDPSDAVIVGQAIVRSVDTRGGGDVKVSYNAGYTYTAPPLLSLER